MWLDRLAGGQGQTDSSSLQPGNRPYSPVPRKFTSGLSPYVTFQRAAATPRGSSLSLISNDSNNSLLGSRRPNGSSLKRAAITPNSREGSEVILTLGGILGGPESAVLDLGSRKPSELAPSKEDLELDFDFCGLSLHGLCEATLGHDAQAVSKQLPQHTPVEYGERRVELEELHKSIQACDDVLNSVEVNLTNFRNDLAAVSADIESLQLRSESLNSRLENRIAVERTLGPLVEELSVPPILITNIIEAQIDESWVKALQEVDRRATAYRNNLSSSCQIRAWSELGPLLEKLAVKSVERIRDFLVAQIRSLRSPHINAQIIQQQSFLKYKDLFWFLHKQQPALADDICQAYLNTMKWYYSDQFSRYEKALEKIKVFIIDKNDVIGHEDTSRKTGVLSAAKHLGSLQDTFNLGRRIDILRTGNRAALSSYLAEECVESQFMEIPFRSFNLALIDNAAAEYTFLAGFFAHSYSMSTISRHFNYIFEPTFALGQTLIKSLIADTLDGLGLLICVRLNQQFAFELQRRKVPTVDGYINATNMLLWPRLQAIMDRNRESIRHLTNSLPTRASPRPTEEQTKQSTAPHLATQRFGQLLHGILALSAEAGDDEPVVTSLRRLRSEMEVFLSRCGQTTWNDQRKTARFLYNNYSLILTIISDVGGKFAGEERDHFERLRNTYG